MTLDAYGIMESSLGLAVGGIFLRIFDRLCHRYCSPEVQEVATTMEREMEHIPSESESEATIILPHYDNQPEEK